MAKIIKINNNSLSQVYYTAVEKKLVQNVFFTLLISLREVACL